MHTLLDQLSCLLKCGLTAMLYTGEATRAQGANHTLCYHKDWEWPKNPVGGNWLKTSISMQWNIVKSHWKSKQTNKHKAAGLATHRGMREVIVQKPRQRVEAVLVHDAFAYMCNQIWCVRFYTHRSLLTDSSFVCERIYVFKIKSNAYTYMYEHTQENIYDTYLNICTYV